MVRLTSELGVLYCLTAFIGSGIAELSPVPWWILPLAACVGWVLDISRRWPDTR